MYYMSTTIDVDDDKYMLIEIHHSKYEFQVVGISNSCAGSIACYVDIDHRVGRNCAVGKDVLMATLNACFTNAEKITINNECCGDVLL